MLLKTSLNEAHKKLQAQMVNFHGWEMPLHYGSQLEEHNAVRIHAGMFDISHMTIVDILGTGGRQFLRKLLTNDIDQLENIGKALYSCMCNEHGGVIDDLIVYQRAADNYRLVLNAATKAKDLAWLHKKSEGFAIGLQERQELGMLAVQGPEAIAKLMAVLTPAQIDAISTLRPFECVEIEQYFFARTGYTGEDGLEIILPAENLYSLWGPLLTAGVKPCGLAARDTLRLEAGMLLYGQDLDESVTPLVSGLGWTVKWQPADRDFIGMGALLSQKQQGVPQKLVGLVLQDPGIMRAKQQVINENAIVGQITSGSYSPTLKSSIALARLSAQVNANDFVMVNIRDKLLSAKVGPLRFVKQGEILWHSYARLNAKQ